MRGSLCHDAAEPFRNPRVLCVGIITDTSRSAYREVIKDLVERGARGVLLGCTEIGLLVGPQDADVPLFDTTRLHAQRAVELALQI